MVIKRGYIILLVGKSGVGKSSVAEYMKKRYKYKILQSYTTRPKRAPNERGHRFVTDEEFDKLVNDMCAYTEFDGYRYCATNKQVRAADIYIIDPAGVKYFREKYKGNKQIIVVELTAPIETLFKRMKKRGDSTFKAFKRIIHDNRAFRNVEADLIINGTDSISTVAETIYKSCQMMVGIQASREIQSVQMSELDKELEILDKAGKSNE